MRDRAVFDANGVEIPTGYRRKMLSMLPVARIYWEVDGKVMIHATVKRICGLRPSFGVHMHNPPLELDAMDDVVGSGKPRLSGGGQLHGTFSHHARCRGR